MRYLLDTHVWLWMTTEPDRLRAAYATIADPDTDLVLSVASCWEIAIKSSIGRLRLPLAVGDYLGQRIASTGVSTLPVDVRHASGVAGLPLHHRDPFDRLLIAQSISEGLKIITADRAFDDYDCDVMPIR